MALQPHVNGEVAVMLVVVGDVVHQHAAPESIGRPRINNMCNLHRLDELCLGGRPVHAIAIDERIVQRLNEYSLVSELFVVSGRWRLFARGLRTEEEVRINQVTDNLTEGPDLRRRSKGIFIRRHVLCRFRYISVNHGMHRLGTGRQRGRQFIGIAGIRRLSGGRRQSHIRKDKNQQHQQAQHRVVSLHCTNRFGQYVDL